MSRNDAAKCPNCGGMIEVDFFDEIGDEILCDSCDAELGIVSKDPLKLRIIKKPDVYDEYRDINDHDDENLE